MKMTIKTWQSKKTGLWWLRIFAANGKQLARITRGFRGCGEPWARVQNMSPAGALYKDSEGQWRWTWETDMQQCNLIASQGYSNRIDAVQCLDQCGKVIGQMMDSGEAGT